MKQSPRIQSRKITDIIKKIGGIPVGKQNHKPGMHDFVQYDDAQMAVFFFLYLGGVWWGGQYCHILIFQNFQEKVNAKEVVDMMFENVSSKGSVRKSIISDEILLPMADFCS